MQKKYLILFFGNHWSVNFFSLRSGNRKPKPEEIIQYAGSPVKIETDGLNELVLVSV